MTAADRWRSELEGWALPAELLASVPDSPYSWPPSLWQRRARSAEERGGVAPTEKIVDRLAGPGGSVLDVGAGTGRASLPLARSGHPLSAVERNPGMAAGFRKEALGLDVCLIEGSWPDVASQVGPRDVVMCAHVVYDVQDIGPFLDAAFWRARQGVVIELTDNHPWSWLTPYYKAIHALERPAGPTADDLRAVVAERFSVEPKVQRWSRPPDLWFENWDEILELYGRRLLLPASRWGELRDLLQPEVIEDYGRLFVGRGERSLVTLWWET